MDEIRIVYDIYLLPSRLSVSSDDDDDDDDDDDLQMAELLYTTEKHSVMVLCHLNT